MKAVTRIRQLLLPPLRGGSGARLRLLKGLLQGPGMNFGFLVIGGSLGYLPRLQTSWIKGREMPVCAVCWGSVGVRGRRSGIYLH
jgi:uncharacterized membrane protein